MNNNIKTIIPGILVLYSHPLIHNAPTIMENVNSFENYSRFKAWAVNTEMGFPKNLYKLQFKVIILHYSLFGTETYLLNKEFFKYLEDCKDSYKIAFFQDEHHFCRQRFGFINRFKIDCIYTLLEPEYFKDVYQKYTEVKRIAYYIPGYVSDSLITASEKFVLPDEKRAIDIGYRGRELPFYSGKGSQEKTRIAIEFKKRASTLGLKLDLEIKEEKRIYGDGWYQFIGNCRAFLGVEAGVSIFDTEDIVYKEYERLMSINPEISFEELSNRLLDKWEDNIYYRTISPRHFEAAAFRVCQILYEGKYSGIMQPMVHYIPLKKDFSNFDEVIRMFKDRSLRLELTENAYKDMIVSGKYGYSQFIGSFDEDLMKTGFDPSIPDSEVQRVTSLLLEDFYLREIKGRFRTLVFQRQFPGRKLLVPFVKPFWLAYQKMRQRGA